MIRLEAILLVWGVRDEVLKKLPVEGYWLYGEYDFIAKVEFADENELREFSLRLTRLVGRGKFKLFPVKLSSSTLKNSAENHQINGIIENNVFYVF
ncbi:hypothetical protein [Thermococcus sp. M39]|uniref:hypothetical protein n=1 Tax=unclassified Thermococcus TaxID=2627626 RepID=UPI003211D91F